MENRKEDASNVSFTIPTFYEEGGQNNRNTVRRATITEEERFHAAQKSNNTDRCTFIRQENLSRLILDK